MYGDFGFRIPVDLEQGKADVEGMTTEFQLGNGKMVHRGGFQNTRIAAIITVHEWQVLNLAVRKFLNTDDGRTRKERYRDSVQHSASTRKRDTGQASSSGSGFIARLLFVDRRTSTQSLLLFFRAEKGAEGPPDGVSFAPTNGRRNLS